ncbi:Hypp8874 [Branchiostoma lanceolatum]|uniref:Hypp8874 protein n=1 Tax=Branchiostoma lanceolatum TaxID=7740 RepID=A0A8K0EGY4_BRALA|nr:Hypp8874 [Branchiostoma lanceolatum]
MFRAVSGVILRPSFHRMMRSALRSNNAQRHCSSITGRWYNLKGSYMDLSDNNGVLEGCYDTGVGELQTAPIVGFPPKKDGGTFGWVVNWTPEEGDPLTTTTWTAQCVDVRGKQVLQTTWILRSEVEKAEDRWESTLVGQDTFHRGRHEDSD